MKTTNSKGKSIVRVIILFLAIATFTTLVLSLYPVPMPVSAYSGDIFGPACGAAVMDGQVNPVEWSSASSQTFEMISPGGTPAFTGTLYVMNSGTNLYMGFTVNDDEFSTTGTWLPSGDSVVLIFDGDLSGSVNELNNNVLGLSAGLPQFEDRYIYDITYGSNQLDTLGGGMANGAGAASRTEGLNHFEFRFPLCSGDALDFCVHTSEALGVRLEYLDAQADGSFGGNQFFPGTLDTSEADILIGQCSVPDLFIYLPLINK
jgi:hypothetical protein